MREVHFEMKKRFAKENTISGTRGYHYFELVTANTAEDEKSQGTIITGV